MPKNAEAFTAGYEEETDGSMYKGFVVKNISKTFPNSWFVPETAKPPPQICQTLPPMLIRFDI